MEVIKTVASGYSTLLSLAFFNFVSVIVIYSKAVGIMNDNSIIFSLLTQAIPDWLEILPLQAVKEVINYFSRSDG